MATWTQTTPSVEPITLAEVKTHLRLTGTAEDVYLWQLIRGARERVEAFTGRALITRTVTLDLTAQESRPPIRLLYPPVASITSVTGYDNDANTTTVSTSNYFLSGDDLYPAPNTSGWAEEAERLAWALRIVYSTGYGSNVEDVPYDLRHALLLWIADQYEMRQSEVLGTVVARSSNNWKSLLRPYRVNKLTEVY